MANTLNTIAGDLIAAKSLEFLTAQYPLLGLIANDFSDSPVAYNQTVVTRLNTVPAASIFDPNVGYVASGVTSTNVNVTIDKHVYTAIEFSEQEVSSTSISLVEEFGQSLAYSIGDKVMTDLGALLTTGNFSNSTVVPITGFDRINAIVKPKAALANRKVNNGLVGLFSPNAESALWEDDSIVSLTFNKEGGVAATELPIVHGVQISRHDALPAGLNGAVLSKEALVFASRTPQIESDVVNGIVKNISNEQGLTLQYRKYHDPVKGKVVIAFTLMYGVAKGNPVAAQLLRQS
jgi:hypothetical protein